jgi:hypothetical protein
LASPVIPPQGLTINRSQPLDFIWAPVLRPNQAKSTFTVAVGTLDGSNNIQCDFPLTKYKRGRVPANILGALPVAGQAFLSFDVRQERAEFLNQGSDSVVTGVLRVAETPGGTLAHWFVILE